MIEAYREARRAAGKEGDGEIVFQALCSWADTDEAAFEAARKWKGAQPAGPLHARLAQAAGDVRARRAGDVRRGVRAERDRRLRPELHVERLRELEELGARVIVLQNNSGADPLRAIEVYGEHVLPALRGARV